MEDRGGSTLAGRTRRGALLAVTVTLLPLAAATASQQGSPHHHRPAHHHSHYPNQPHWRRLTYHVKVAAWYSKPLHSVVHAARIDPHAPVAFRVVPASPHLADGRLSRTSTMCRRVHCLVAVNGSFRDIPSRLPRGGEIVNRAPVRLRQQEPLQAMLASRHPMRAGGLHTRIRLHLHGHQHLSIGAVNVPPAAGSVSLYTPRYGGRTPALPHVTAVRAWFTHHADFHLGRSLRLHLGTPYAHSVRVPQHGVVLVARGRAAQRLRKLARAATAHRRFRLSSGTHVPQSLSTSYRFLRHGGSSRPTSTGRSSPGATRGPCSRGTTTVGSG